MGPLVPDIVSNELNLLVALVIGIAFGFLLEQAGFSSSRKLTGLFYGTDFTVLRVFFTAGVTAMLGVVLLDQLGLLDLDVVYVNPTYVVSALVGGGLMGIGFVVGGYCPGTSFCGAAIGKVDAIVFVAGGFLGVVGFAELFPLVEHMYTAGSFGDLAVYSALGMPRGAFVLAMSAMAIAVFLVTTRIERRVNPQGPAREFVAGRHRLGGVALLSVAVGVSLLPDRKERLLGAARDEGVRRAEAARIVTADELAFRILDEDPRLLVVDVRGPEEFARMSLPGAVNIPVVEMFGKEWRDVLGHPAREKVFIAETGEDALTAATLAGLLRYERVAALEGGLAGFRSGILQAKAPAGRPLESLEDAERFRARAGPALATLIAQRGAPKPAARRVPKIVGGCGT
jgi:hypothetical protein